MLGNSPYLLYSDGKGNIFEDTTLYSVGRCGWEAIPVQLHNWIEMPEGGSLYELPGRRGLGIDTETLQMRICDKGWAVAAFIPPAHTGLFLAAYETLEDAPTLPLFCYTAASWYNNKFYVAAVRIDEDIRQECNGFDPKKVEQGVENFLKAYPNNRLVKHLAENCALTYQCPAARNYFMGRWECPVPTSPACNANCIGCISFQPDTETITATQDRLTFKPTVEEIVEFTVSHLETAPYPIISFGQGCEGEPLLMWETIRDAIIEIRKHTQKGCINLNTNGSKPDAVEKLMEAGLNSIRISLNSAQPDIYNKYYQPNNYTFDDVIESIKIVKKHRGWVSINYFVFPGITDSIQEVEAICNLIAQTGIDMIQWRNFNIDPDWYLNKMELQDPGQFIGILQMMDIIEQEFEDIKYGYFNPSKERMENFGKDFAH